MVDKVCSGTSPGRRSRAAQMSAVGEVVVGCLLAFNSLPPALTVIWSRRLRGLSMYQLVASVMLAETLTGIISIVLGSMNLLQIPISNWACAVGVHLRHSVGKSTAVTYFCIGLERYVTVIHGLRYYDILTDCRRRLLLAASWFFAVIFFFIGLALQWSTPDGVDLRGKKCEHWRVITPEFRFFGAVFSLIIFLVNAGMNIRIGMAAFRQAQTIRSMEASVGRGHIPIQFHHRGFLAIAALSLMHCVLAVPNAVSGATLQGLGIRLQTTNIVTGLMRVFGMIADGWCFILFCPMLREEGMKLLGCRPKCPYVSVQTPGNDQPSRENLNRFGEGFQIAMTQETGKGRDNSGPETPDSKTVYPARKSPVSSSTDQAESQSPPIELRRGLEVLLTSLDLDQNSATNPPGSNVASLSSSSKLSEHTPGNHQPKRENANQSGEDSQIALTQGMAKDRDNSDLETPDSKTVSPAKEPVASPSPDQAESQSPPTELSRGLEVLLTSLDLDQNSATNPFGSDVASLSSSSKLSEHTSGNDQPKREKVNHSGEDFQIAMTQGTPKDRDNSGPETPDSKTLSPAKEPVVSPSPDQAEAQSPPTELSRGLEVLLTPLDLGQNSATNPSGSDVASLSSSSLPFLARPPRQNALSWSRYYSN